MMFGMAAATSALDLIKTLTQAGSPSKSSQTAKFSAASNASATPGASHASAAGRSSLISPDTMNALFAAQSQHDPSAADRATATVEKLLQRQSEMLTRTGVSSLSVSV